jgi:hypothetical protein
MCNLLVGLAATVTIVFWAAYPWYLAVNGGSK